MNYKENENESAEKKGAEERLKNLIDQKKTENNVAPDEPITTSEGVVVPDSEKK